MVMIKVVRVQWECGWFAIYVRSIATGSSSGGLYVRSDERDKLILLFITLYCLGIIDHDSGTKRNGLGIGKFEAELESRFLLWTH